MLRPVLRPILSSASDTVLYGNEYGDDEISELMLTLKNLTLHAPGIAGLPTLMSSPPTVALSASGAATGIASSVRFRMDTPGSFRYHGIEKPIYSAGTDAWTSTGRFLKSTDSPWAVEFIFDTVDATGRFEILLVGKNAGMRVMVNGQYATLTGETLRAPSNGGLYNGLVTLGAAGTYRIRLEMDAGVFFRGINAGPTDRVSATARKTYRVAIAGDSYTEPTVVDSVQTPCHWDGYGQKLAYMLDLDVVSCGSGGTGYVNPGTSPKVKMYDRIADVIGIAANAYIFALGLNDFANSPATIYTEALNCFRAIRIAWPDAPIFVLSPWYKAGYHTYPTGLLAARDAIRDAAAMINGTFWIDSLTTFVEASTLSTPGVLAASAALNATSISSSVAFPVNSFIQIGDARGANLEVRRVITCTGTGPFAIAFNGTGFANGGGPLLNAHTAGEAIVQCGTGIITGAGKQGTPNAAAPGTADRNTSSDATHPTVPGHRNDGEFVYREIKRWAAIA